MKLNVAIRRSGFRIKQIADGLVCNGVDSVSFALANVAEKTAKYMANKSSVNQQESVAKLQHIDIKTVKQ